METVSPNFLVIEFQFVHLSPNPGFFNLNLFVYLFPYKSNRGKTNAKKN